MRKRKKSKSIKKLHTVNIPSHSTHSFLNKHSEFHTFKTVSQFLKYRGISYKIEQHLDGPGEYKDGEYNCNMVFFSHYLPEKRKIVAYWDYERQFLYF